MKFLHALLASFAVLFAVSFVIPQRPVEVSTDDVVAMHLESAQVGGLVACTPQQKATLKTAIDVTGYLCVLAHAALPDVATIAEACNIDASLTPALKQIVDDFKARREAYAREQMAAMHCASASDGGK